LTDDEIVKLYWERKEAAISASEKQYGKYCNSIAYGILNSHEDSEECVNETWLNAWNAIPPQQPNKLSLFLGKITRNLAFDKYKADRAKKRGGGEIVLVLEELEDCVPSENSTEQTIIDKAFDEIVNRFLHALPERECNIFLSRYWYSSPLKKIAEEFSMTENNVKASLFRSRAKLKQHLEREGILL
jgi:RNA polymerase sigma factor (sigma-70 family)